MAAKGFSSLAQPAAPAAPGGSAFAGFQLPSVGGPTDLSRGGLLQNYNANWQASRNANQDLFNRTVSGFDSILAGQKADLGAVSDEYRQRQRAVMKGLTGANEANERDIERQFAALRGQSMVDLAGRGLGNSTITSSVQRGLGHSMADALTRSRNDFATSIANQRTNWGMAALAQKQQAALANSGLASQHANTLFQGTNVGYPDMGAYAQMIASIPDQNLDRLLAGGGGGGPGVMGGGGGLLQFDPSRPVGGPGPRSSAFYTGGMASGDVSFPGAPGLQQAANPFTGGGKLAAGFDPAAWGNWMAQVGMSMGGGGYQEPASGGYTYGGDAMMMGGAANAAAAGDWGNLVTGLGVYFQ